MFMFKWAMMRHVVAMLEDDDSEITRLSFISLAKVFKDICPGFKRILALY